MKCNLTIVRKILQNKMVRKAYLNIMKIAFYGKKHKCNICNSNLRKFKPYGIKHEIFEKNTISQAGYRKNCLCPACRAKDRIRLIYYCLEKYTDIFTGSNKILHIAPEYQIKEKILENPLANYIDGDLNKNKASVVVDLTNLQFEDNTFDYIICNQVLEHIPDEEKAITELKRVIKPNKKIIITVPICITNKKTIEDKSITDPQKRLEMYCKEDHVRLYGLDFKERLERYGLNVKEYYFEKEESKEEFIRYGMPEYGVIFIASKQ